MAITIHKLENLSVSKWSGGTTIQLFIWPEDSDFSKKKFDFRLSTATVEVEESDFTPMPDFERKLMVLKGEIAIDHIGHYSITLKPFEQDHFLGEWKTKSKGKVVDFNVIYRHGAEIELIHTTLKKGEEYFIQTSKSIFIYLFKGLGLINDTTLNKGELLEINNSESEVFKAQENCVLIQVEWKNRI